MGRAAVGLGGADGDEGGSPAWWGRVAAFRVPRGAYEGGAPARSDGEFRGLPSAPEDLDAGA